MLKMAVHGWGYTRTPSREESAGDRSYIPSSPLIPPRERANFAPSDEEQRLRQGLVEMLPELGDRPFERLALCCYTDTPSGDFIMDYHLDYRNLFVGGADSGQYGDPRSCKRAILTRVMQRIQVSTRPRRVHVPGHQEDAAVPSCEEVAVPEGL